MRTQKTLLASFAVLLLSFSTLGQDKFRLSLHVSCKQTNDQGKIVRKSFNARDVIDQCVKELGIAPSNRPPLLLVYHVNASFQKRDHIETINATNGAVLCTNYIIAFGSVVTNQSALQIERQAFFFNDKISDAIGSALLSERVIVDNNGVTNRMRISGRIQLGLPATATSPTRICSGVLTAGKAFQIIP